MRSNPHYQNICWIQYGRYQLNKCVSCNKKEECDTHYDPHKQEWTYPILPIPKPENAPSKVTFRPKKNGYYDTWMKGIY